MATSPVGVALDAALLCVGFSICHSTLQTRATEVFPTGRGTALSLFAFSLFLGGGAGSVGMGFLLDRYGYQRGFALAGAAFLLFAGYAWRVLRPRSGADADVTGSGVLPARPSR